MKERALSTSCPICMQPLGKKTKQVGKDKAFITFHDLKGCGCLIHWEKGKSPRKVTMPESLILQSDFNPHWRELCKARGITLIGAKK